MRSTLDMLFATTKIRYLFFNFLCILACESLRKKILLQVQEVVFPVEDLEEVVTGQEAETEASVDQTSTNNKRLDRIQRLISDLPTQF